MRQGIPHLQAPTRAVLTLALASLLAAGCLSSRSGAPRRDGRVDSTSFRRSDAMERLSAEELDELTNAFADRYRTLLEDAVSAIIARNPDPMQRAVAQQLLVESTTSMYDIATNGDPFSQVLDMTIVATLTSQVWIDDDRGTREFGERAEPLVSALRQAREEIWAIAARVFTPDQLSALDFMIASWRRDNRGVENVAFVRFDDFAETRGAAIISDAAGGGGLFEGIDRAVAQAKSYEMLAERVFYLSKRAPTLVNWQSQAVIDGILARAEIRQALENLDAATRAANEAVASTGRLASEIPALVTSEREAIFAEIDRRQEEIDGALGQVNAIAGEAAKATADVRASVERVEPILADANRTLEAAQPTLAALERLAATSERILVKVEEIKGPPAEPGPDAPPAPPLDVHRALEQANEALGQANALLERGESLGASPAIKGLIDDVTHATEQRIESLEASVSRLIWLAGGVAAGVVALSAGIVYALRATAAREGGSR